MSRKKATSQVLVDFSSWHPTSNLDGISEKMRPGQDQQMRLFVEKIEVLASLGIQLRFE